MLSNECVRGVVKVMKTRQKIALIDLKWNYKLCKHKGNIVKNCPVKIRDSSECTRKFKGRIQLEEEI